jgi:hypothetical protein
VAASTGTPHLSLHDHVRSVFLHSATSVVQRSGHCQTQGLGSVVDMQDICCIVIWLRGLVMEKHHFLFVGKPGCVLQMASFMCCSVMQ